jgi:hypothetical protein
MKIFGCSILFCTFSAQILCHCSVRVSFLRFSTWQAGLDRSIHVPGYHALDSVGTERKIQNLARSMFRKDIIGGGLAGSIHGSAYLKLNALQSGFNG